MIELLTSPEAWAALLTLTALEIVLVIDNVIFLSVIVSRIPEPQATRARRIGLALALIFRIVLPTALSGLVTGVLLAIARAAGETAPLLFTAFSNRYWSPGWNQPSSSLPVMIYTYAVAPYDDWHQQAWAAGLVLLALVLVANIAARMILHRQAHAARGDSSRRQ